MAARGLTDALDLGEPRRIQRALAYFVINTCTRMPGDGLLVEAETRAHDLARELGDEVGLAWAELASGFHAVYRHEFAAALAALAEAERRFLAGPAHAREATLARLATVMVCGNYGVDIPYAERRHAGCTEEATARGDVFSAMWSTFVRCLLDLVIGEPRAARARLAMVRATWPRAVDSLFSATTLLNELAIELYEDAGGAWDAVTRIEPEYRQLFSSLLPFTIQVYCRLVANCAVGAYAAGRADRAATLRRIEPLLDLLAPLRHRSIHDLVAGHVRLIEGDVAGSLAARAQAAEGWRTTHQHAFAQAVLLRGCELRGDEAGAQACTAELRRLAVGDPARFADVFAGPLARR